MWWGLAKSSVAFLLLLLSCVPRAPEKKNATLYLASCLHVIKDDIAALAPKDLHLNLIFQSSSVIAQQIVHGASCEVAIVADERWRDHLIAKGAAFALPKPLALNSLVVVASKKGPEYNNAHELLSNIGAEKLIIADPDYVPLGAYSKEALIALGFYQRLENQLLRAHSARNAVVLLEERAAPLAIVYATDSDEQKTYRVASIDKSLHSTISYPVLMCRRADKGKAQVLIDLLYSKAFKRALLAKGFEEAL